MAKRKLGISDISGVGSAPGRHHGIRSYSRSTLRGILQRAGLPQWWIVKCIAAAAVAWLKCTVPALEVFSGEAELTLAMSLEIAGSLSFDLRESTDHDIATDAGQQLLLEFFFRVEKRGLLWLGVPCESWIAMASRFTRRSVFQLVGPPPKFRTKTNKNILHCRT